MSWLERKPLRYRLQRRCRRKLSREISAIAVQRSLRLGNCTGDLPKSVDWGPEKVESDKLGEKEKRRRNEPLRWGIAYFFFLLLGKERKRLRTLRNSGPVWCGSVGFLCTCIPIAHQGVTAACSRCTQTTLRKSQVGFFCAALLVWSYSSHTPDWTCCLFSA